MVAGTRYYLLLTIFAEGILVTKQDNNHDPNHLDPFNRFSGPLSRHCNEVKEFRCVGDGRCLPRVQHCDGVADCEDHSDETYCGNHCDHVSMFHCDNDECVHNIFRCDHSNDCGDWSDERFCQRSDERRVLDDTQPKPTACKPDHFFCDITCVPNDWKCDGSPDCFSGADEEGCNVTLPANECTGADKFACGNQCIPLKWVCDGSVECIDGSDEANCDSRDHFGKCSLDHGFFECHDRKCLPASQICNNASDCSKGEDEGGACGLLCPSTCSHKCLSTPAGPRCICQQGFKLSPNNKTCEDIDECHQDWSVCSQKCTNTHGSYSCSCHEGFQLRHDNLTCTIDGHGETIYFSTSTEIRSLAYRTPSRSNNFLDADHWEMSKVLRSLTEPRALSADVHQRLMIVIDGTSVFKVTKDGMHKRRILSNGLSTPESVAIDWIGNNFYLTDSGTKQIIVCTIEEIQCTILLSGTPLERPRAVSVDPLERVIFWTDFVEGRTGSAYIGKANMDGTDHKQLVVEGLQFPSTLAVDTDGKRIYWGDAGTRKIESINYLGQDRKTIVSEVFNPVGLDVFGDWLYWVDRDLQEIQHCLKASGKRKGMILKHTDDHMTSVLVSHSLKQRKQANICTDAGCSHICLLSPKEPSFTCSCPNGFNLNTDGKTCTVSKSQELVVISTGALLIVVDPHILGDSLVSTSQLPKGMHAVTSLAYDPANNSVIFAESDTETIYRYDFSDDKIVKLLETRSGFVEGLAIDHSTGNIYWVDSENKKVAVSNEKTGMMKAIVSNLTRPSGLAIVPEYGLLFVADAGGVHSTPRIIKYSLDGRNERNFTADLPAPAESLFYDSTSEMLYWTYGPAAALGGYIDRAGIHSDKVSTYRKNLNSPESIAVSSSFVYWASQRTASLEWADKTSIKGIKKLHFGHAEPENTFANLRRITVVQSSNPLKNRNSCQTASCSYLCIPLPDGKHVCECPQGMNPKGDGVSCKKVECDPGQFQCIDGGCINERQRCNGKRDCMDGADELDCESACDEISHFLCKNKDCIPKKFVCDGGRDCPDNSDEINCQPKPANCTVDEYKCKTGFDCVPLMALCNHTYECPDKSDEYSCLKDCLPGLTHCSGNTAICILEEAVCDGYDDCPRATDEANCPFKSATEPPVTGHHWKCPEGARLCHDGNSCVQEANLCDGEDDCDDGSDETHCKEHPDHLHGDLSCPRGTFSCYRGFVECIPLASVCNCSAECFHGEDELHCPPTSCHIEGQAKADSKEDRFFTCPGKDNFHIPLKWVCDGEPDCNDGYDEQAPACNSTKVVDVEGCPRNFFQCNNGQCIHLESVCDDVMDCDDISDEGKGCGRTCASGHCTHNCTRTPSGPKCYCSPGFKLGRNGHTCEDINECAVAAIRSTFSSFATKHSHDEHPDLHHHHDEDLIADECSQMCENVKGGYRCKCSKGYRLTPDGHSCKAVSRPYMLFTTLHNIRSLKADKRIPDVVPVVAHSDDGVVDLDFDIERQTLFWLSHHGFVYSTNETAMINSHENHRVDKYDLGLKNPQAFTYDWVNQEFFVADRHDDISTVKACKLKPSICAPIHTTHSLITDVAADPVVKMIFWSEAQSVRSAYRKGLIGTMSMDGKQSWFFSLTHKVLYPVSLTLDPIRRKIYWADMQKNTIETASYNGHGHSVIVRHLEDAPISVSFFESRIYWVSERSNILSFISLQTKEVRHSNLTFHHTRQVRIHHPLLQPKAETACFNSPCSDICVESDPRKRGYVCVCPEDRALDVSGHTCISTEVLRNSSGNPGSIHGDNAQRNGITAASIVICLVLIATAIVVAVAYNRKNRRLQRSHPSMNVSWLRFRPPTNNLAEDSLTLEDSLSIDYAEELRRRQVLEQQKKSQYNYGARGVSVKQFLTPVKHFAKKTASSAANLASRAKSSLSNTLGPKSPLLKNGPSNFQNLPAPTGSGIFVDIPVNPYGDVSTDMLSPRESQQSEEGGFVREGLLISEF